METEPESRIENVNFLGKPSNFKTHFLFEGVPLITGKETFTEPFLNDILPLLGDSKSCF